MIARSVPRPRFAVDVRRAGLVAQRIRNQRQVDAQAEVAAEAGLAVIPPAEEAAFAVMQAIGVVQAEVEQSFQRGALGGGGEGSSQ